MFNFISEVKRGSFQVELIVDSSIFSVDDILKASYELVDKVYMFFHRSGDDVLVQFKLKDDSLDLDDIVNSFGEELVYHKLRKDIDIKTSPIKEKIIQMALGYGLTLEDIKDDIHGITKKVEQMYNESQQTSQVNSLENIISDIESDPDFADDKDEIISILKEIQSEENK